MKMIKGTDTFLLEQPLKLLIKYVSTYTQRLLFFSFLQVIIFIIFSLSLSNPTLFYKKQLALKTNKRKNDLIIIKNTFVSFRSSSLNKDWAQRSQERFLQIVSKLIMSTL